MSCCSRWRSLPGGQARPFVVAFGFLFIGLAPLLVSWLPAVSLGLIGRMVMTGSALEMLLLSLAIADRFAALQQEKIAAQAEAVAEAERRHRMQEIYAGELEQEVRERTRELAAANADKDRMMAVLGHDLRSPLTALTLAAEQTPVREGLAQEAAQTGRALLLLLEDVVVWARLRVGADRVAVQPVETVVAPAVDLHRAAAAQRGVALEVLATPGRRVRTDLVLSQTLVRNLTSNALKSARSRVVVTVASTPSGLVRIGVRDDGPGLPPEVSAHLQNGSADQPGSGTPWHTASGLGLRLCLEIAQALGTRLEAAVPDGGGTEISFTLPRAEG
jgi:signal transduction histidine kinase